MLLLILVTVLWAFSFSLIGVYLAGSVDPYFSVWIRVALAALLFLPFLRKASVFSKPSLALVGIGAIQLGLMYVCYYNSFLLLSVPEVLVFTILTPLYVAIFDDLFERRAAKAHWISALIAVAGAAVIRAEPLSSDFIKGFLTVQGANACFAFGQVAYKKLRERSSSTQPPQQSFAFFYIGALIIATVSWLILGEEKFPQTFTQWGILLWLGLGASGLGYFMWNLGATRVNAGTLAVMNNALIPAGLLVNLTIWNREADLIRLGIGSAIIIAGLGLSIFLGKKTT